MSHPETCAPEDDINLAGHRGAALIVSLMMMTLLAALGLSLTLTCMAETNISHNYSRGVETLYGAEGAVERAIGELLAVPDWTLVLDGTVTGGDRDGPPGMRMLPDGSALDLRVAPVGGGPWGANNPQWGLYTSAPLASMLPQGIASSMVYVTVWAADDAGESDGNPLVDSNGTILLVAQAYGRGGLRRTIEVAIAKALAPESDGGGQIGIRVLSWREVH
jgi:hypothetical protein